MSSRLHIVKCAGGSTETNLNGISTVVQVGSARYTQNLRSPALNVYEVVYGRISRVSIVLRHSQYLRKRTSPRYGTEDIGYLGYLSCIANFSSDNVANYPTVGRYDYDTVFAQCN